MLNSIQIVSVLGILLLILLGVGCNNKNEDFGKSAAVKDFPQSWLCYQTIWYFRVQVKKPGKDKYMSEGTFIMKMMV